MSKRYKLQKKINSARLKTNIYNIKTTNLMFKYSLNQSENTIITSKPVVELSMMPFTAIIRLHIKFNVFSFLDYCRYVYLFGWLFFVS